MPQLYARPVAQVDVEKDTNNAAEIVEIFKGFRRGKQHAAVPVLPQQPSYAPQQCGIVIHDNNNLLI